MELIRKPGCVRGCNGNPIAPIGKRLEWKTRPAGKRPNTILMQGPGFYNTALRFVNRIHNHKSLVINPVNFFF